MVKKLFILKNNTYIANVIEETSDTWKLENPMLIEHELDLNSRVSFKYLPWQVISDDPRVTIDKNNIIFVVEPKKELQKAYDDISNAFIKNVS